MWRLLSSAICVASRFDEALCGAFAEQTVLTDLPSAFAAPASNNDATSAACNTVETGYNCNLPTSHEWGQYSPYYAVPSNISEDVPGQCLLTFVQILSRHGARYPTASKGAKYNSTIAQLKKNVKSYPGKYAFLATYNYTLSTDNLTTFGQQELVDSGAKFYKRYEPLTDLFVPFVRAASEARVVQSAQNFTQGFHAAKTSRSIPDPKYPYPILVISEDAGSNNTLNHGLCTEFENGTDSTTATQAQLTYQNVFVPAIQNRINTDLAGAKLSATQIVYLMDLCPFETVASPNGTLSPFCNLFTDAEFQQYDYYQSLGKWYGYGPGNNLGPTQGAGWVTELVSRLTTNRTYVKSEYTSINHTLDDAQSTFPLGIPLYADFSHDNDITSALSALGLFNNTANLSNTTLQTVQQTNGYSAGYTVSFSARTYVEKMICAGSDEELVRFIVNDRVVPLPACKPDALGRCTLSNFVASQSFALTGGKWSQCF